MLSSVKHDEDESREGEARNRIFRTEDEPDWDDVFQLSLKYNEGGESTQRCRLCHLTLISS